MRSRTELVTTQLEGSDFEDEPSDLEDSEEDWKPEPNKTKRKRNALCSSLRKNGNRKRKTIKKSNNNKKRNNKKAKKEYSSSSEDQDSNDTIESDKNSKSSLSSLESKENFLLPKPLNRKINNIRSFPDRNGIWELLIDKNDLKYDLMKNKDLCLWRRDGSSLLQKYIRDNSDEPDSNTLAFISSSVYSCWEDRRKNDFLEIKVQCFGDKKGGRVKIIDEEILKRINKTSKNNDDNDDVDEENDDSEEDNDDEAINENGTKTGDDE